MKLLLPNIIKQVIINMKLLLANIKKVEDKTSNNINFTS